MRTRANPPPPKIPLSALDFPQHFPRPLRLTNRRTDREDSPFVECGGCDAALAGSEQAKAVSMPPHSKVAPAPGRFWE